MNDAQFFLLATLAILVSLTNSTISNYRRTHTKLYAMDQQQHRHPQDRQDAYMQMPHRPALVSFATAPPALPGEEDKIQEISGMKTKGASGRWLR